MTTLLVGDIGGTNGRFALVERGALRLRDVLIEKGDDHSSFDGALGAYLETLSERPACAAFAVAGPVRDGRTARITNRPAWEIDADALRARFGFERVALMNDFVAQAASLPHLEESETVTIGEVRPTGAPKAAVGPGTGLGVAALLPERDGWRPVAGEGGHVEFAAVDAREAAAFDVVRRALGRVSAEDVLSGPGLARLHAALARVEGRAVEGASPSEIVAAARGGDARSRETVSLFTTMLARFAGDVALTFGAEGGVYLCGGVAPKLLDAFDASAFRAAFEAKRPHENLMRRIATLVVTAPTAGLIGCAAAARRAGAQI